MPDQETLALLVSAAAALVAAFALGHSIVTARAERRDRQAGLDLVRQQLADERRRHEEQVALERERRLDERRATLLVRQGTLTGGAADDDYQVFVRNGGRAAARAIQFHVVNELGQRVTRSLAP